MPYRVELDPGAQATLDALPPAAAAAAEEALVVLELVPYNGVPVDAERNPNGPLRHLFFGDAGMMTYLIADHDDRVDVLLITWVG